MRDGQPQSFGAAQLTAPPGPARVQLILSSSSDSQVVLSNVASLSSDLYGDIDLEDDEDAEAKKPLPDGRLTSYEHEDSVCVYLAAPHKSQSRPSAVHVATLACRAARFAARRAP